MKKLELQQIIREEIQNTLKNKSIQSRLNKTTHEKILSSGEAEDFLNAWVQSDEATFFISSFLKAWVQSYIEDTIDTAGEELDFGGGVIGFDNGEQLIKDFIKYLQVASSLEF